MNPEKNIQVEKVLAEAVTMAPEELTAIAENLRYRARKVREQAELEASRLDAAARAMDLIANPELQTKPKKYGLSPEITEQIAVLYRAGKTSAEIAAELGLRRGSVGISIASMKARGRLQDAVNQD